MGYDITMRPALATSELALSVKSLGCGAVAEAVHFRFITLVCSLTNFFNVGSLTASNKPSQIINCTQYIIEQKLLFFRQNDFINVTWEYH